MLKLENYGSWKGDVTGGGSYEAGASVTIVATPFEHYEFTGWYEGDKLLSSDEAYTFLMPDHDYSLSAKFNDFKYTLRIETDPSEGGTVTGQGKYVYDADVNVQASTNEGYTFQGWYDGETLLSTDPSYWFAMPGYNYALIARWTINVRTLTVVNGDPTMGSVTGGGAITYGANASIEATPNEHYSFLGWYDESNELVSDSPSYTFTMPDHDYTLTARFAPLKYFVSIIGDDDAGKTTESGEYAYQSNVTVTASPNRGYSFLGWYDESDSLVCAETNYTFSMPGYDILLIAKYTVNSYSVTLHNEDETAGSVRGSGIYEYGSEVTATATPNEGYSFLGWYKGDALVSSEESYVFTLSDGDVDLTAKWSVNRYTITLQNDNESRGYLLNASGAQWFYGETVQLGAVPYYQYRFVGWYEGDTLVSAEEIYEFTMPARPLTLTAKWSGKTFVVSVEVKDSSAGTITGAGENDYESTVNLVASANEGYEFVGWYDEDGALLSSSRTYSFEMPYHDVPLTAKFLHPGEDAVLSGDGKTLRYGFYPQTHVSNSSLIASLSQLTTTNSVGYYSYNGCYYVKSTAATNSISSTCHKFEDETTFQIGDVCWFKCDPIEWRVLSVSSGDYFIASRRLLDACPYSLATADRSDQTDYEGNSGSKVYSNNYQYSNLRTFLNTTFYNAAFFLDSDNIQKTTLDNSAATTCSGTNVFACGNTSDKVFALSYQDMVNADYGFVSSTGKDNSRVCFATDYALSRGVYTTYISNGTTTWYAGIYSTRSPSNQTNNGAMISVVSSYGVVAGEDSMNPEDYSVRPAMHIKLS